MIRRCQALSMCTLALFGGLAGGMLAEVVLSTTDPVAAQPEPRVPRMVTAERFIVTNRAGIRRAMLGLDEKNAIALTLFDEKGHDRLILQSLASGLATMSVKDERQQERVRLAFDEESRATLDFKDHEGRRRAVLSVTADGVPSLALTGHDGQAHASIGVMPDGEAFVTMSSSHPREVSIYLGTRMEHQNASGVHVATSTGSSSLVVSGDGDPALLQQRDGKGTIGLYTTDEGAVIGLFDQHRTARAMLDLDQESVRLRFFGQDGESRLGLGAFQNDAAALVFRGTDEDLAGIIGTDHDGRLMASDGQGKEIWPRTSPFKR